MTNLLQDVRYALRLLAKNPVFTAVAVLTLALGIGANTAIFTLMNALLLRSLPVDHPEELVLLGGGRNWGMVSGVSKTYTIFSYAQYRYLVEHNQSFSGLAAFGSTTAQISVRRGAGTAPAAENAVSKLVSGNYFQVLGVPPLLGRTFNSQDDRPEAPPVAVISYRYWSREFSRSPEAVGHNLNVNGTPFTIIGVAPSQFFGESVQADPAEMWFPIKWQPQVMARPSVLEDTDARWLHLMGRLLPGTGYASANVALTTQIRQFLQSDPEVQKQPEALPIAASAVIEVAPGGAGESHLRNRYSEPLRILILMVAMLLIIACANLANMLLARATAREREIAVRVALGASRRRLLQQLLTESILLAMLGGVAGLLVATLGTRALLGLVFRGAQTIVVSATPDIRVLAFLLAVSVAAGILFGMMPAWRTLSENFGDSLKGASRGGGQGFGRRGRFGVARALVAAQVALSLLLIVGAALLMRSLVKLLGQDFGFEPSRVLVININPQIAGYKPGELLSLYNRIQQRVNSLPGVHSSALALYTPLSGDNWSGQVVIPGYTTPANKDDTYASWTRVTPGFFETLGTPILLGRSLGIQDTGRDFRGTVINEAMARQYFAGENPVGRHFGWSDENPNEFEVIGVAKDAKHVDPRSAPPPMYFLPMGELDAKRQGTDTQSSYLRDLLVRCDGDPAVVAASVRQVLREVAPTMPVIRVSTLQEQVSASLNKEEIMGGLAAFFGLVALVLASVGLYGLMAYAVARRTPEIGVRMALGAQREQVLWMILREVLVLAGMGVVVGVPVVLAATRFISSQLFGLSPNDPGTLLSATVVLLVVAVGAGFIPAYRASTVDPMVALRYE